jgi:hypothetical protein
MLVVKPFGSPLLFVARDRDDLVMPAEFGEPPEPASMQLERLYHAPSYGEDE